MAGESELQLLGNWASPYTNRVQMALKLKSIEHEFINEENFYGKNKSERIVKANPVHRKIPVLLHGHNTISESLIIIQYIDDVWTGGPSILPSHPYDRSIARFWAAYTDDTWFPNFKKLEKASGDAAKAEIVGKIFEGLSLMEEAFVNCSKGKAFFGGDNIGYIDIVLGSYLGWIKAMEMGFSMKIVDENKTPALASWAQRFVSHDVAKDFISAPHKLLDHYMMVQHSMASS